MHDRREAVGGAGGVGDDVMVGGIVKVVVDSHHDSQVLALGRRGDDHFFCPGLDVALGFLGGGEQAGGLDHDVHSEFLPRQTAGLAGADDFDLVAVDDDGVIPAMSDLAGEGALRRVVFHEVGEVVRRDDVAHGHHVDRVADEALFHHCTISQTTDAAESVDCYFYCHS